MVKIIEVTIWVYSILYVEIGTCGDTIYNKLSGFGRKLI